MSDELDATVTEDMLRAALDDMRNAGVNNELAVVTTPAVRRQMAQWGLCIFARDSWFWNGYEVIADENIPADNLYVVSRSSLPLTGARVEAQP